MVKVNFYNEKGNVAPKVREAVRKQIASKVQGIVSNGLKDFDVVANVNGGFSIAVAQDVKGNPIYAHFSLVVNDKSPEYKAEKSKSKSKADKPKAEVVVDIFADADNEAEAEDEDAE